MPAGLSEPHTLRYNRLYLCVNHFNFFVPGFTSPSHCCLKICLYHKDGLGLIHFLHFKDSED